MSVVCRGYTTKERHSEVKRALVGFLEDHEMNKFTVPVSFFCIKTTSATSEDVCLARRLQYRGSSVVIRDVKEKLCCIASDYNRAQIDYGKFRQEADPHYIITVGAERFRCASVFPASFIGFKAGGVHDTSFHCIKKCDVDRESLHVHVMLSVGTTMFQWTFEHMTKELTVLPPSTMKVKMFASPV